MPKVCVVFDLDDTLFLERDYVISGFEAVGKWAAGRLAIPHFASECIERFEGGQRHDIFDSVLRAHLEGAPPGLVASLVESYRTHSPRIELASDARAALAGMPQDWPVAVLTDGPVASQSRKCAALGLRSRASLIVMTGELGPRFWKPGTAGFEDISARVAADAFAYVGDNPDKDFVAPRQLGWTAVRIRRPRGLHYAASNCAAAPPDFEIADCRELVSILSHL